MDQGRRRKQLDKGRHIHIHYTHKFVFIADIFLRPLRSSPSIFRSGTPTVWAASADQFSNIEMHTLIIMATKGHGIKTCALSGAQ